MRPVVVLRPEPGASSTAARASALGLNARAHPLFAIQPLAWTMPEGDFDGLLLTSANAVRHAGALPSLPVYAVGEATAGAARAAGAEVVAAGNGGVDALIGYLPASLTLLHLCGEERIEPTMSGPQVIAVPVYRAVPLEAPDPAFLQGAVLLIHSPAAGRRAADIVEDRAATRIAAISRTAAAACGPGWDRIEAAPEPTDAALLSLAAELCKD